MSEQQQFSLGRMLSRLKMIMFELLYVLDSNKFTNIHLLAIVELLQPLASLYYYANPIFSHLNNMSLIKRFHDNIWSQIVIFIPNQSPFVTMLLQIVFPGILLAMIVMKFLIGYQYLLILVIQLFLLIYPLVFVKFIIDAIDIITGHDQEYTGIGVILFIMHLIGSIAALQLYGKKHKLLTEIIIIILIQLNVTQFAVLSLIILRLGYLYFFTQQTILKQFKINFQLSLLLVLCFCYFASDTLTNYISFAFLLGTFSLSPFIQLIQHYEQYNHLLPQHYHNIFYSVQNIQSQQPTVFKLKFYEFLQGHIIDCVDVHCSCTQLARIKQSQQFNQKALQFLDKLYSFKKDYDSLIEYGNICSTHFGHKLSGLIPIYSHMPQSLYQQYTSYSIITSYSQQYRQGDRNYNFGHDYHTFYQDLRLFEEKIQHISITLKEFWLTILEFDGSRKFLQMILEISQQINQITKLFDLYIDKYDQHRGYFLYLYKTFQLVILNSHHNNNALGNNNQVTTSSKKLNISGLNNHLTSLTKQQKVTVPQRMLFFVADEKSKIINCNRQFCNQVEIDRQQLLTKTYNVFVPKYCQQQHKQWVQEWFNDCHKDQQFTSSIKTLQLQSGYIKSSQILTRILPRFQHGLQTITFVKIITELVSLSSVLLSSQSQSQPPTQQKSVHNINVNSTNNMNKNTPYQQQQQQQFNNDDELFSVLIESQSMKIIAIDESLFSCINIQQTEESMKKVLSLRLNQIFPKFLNNFADTMKQEGQYQSGGYHKKKHKDSHNRHHKKDGHKSSMKEQNSIEKQIEIFYGNSITKSSANKRQKANIHHNRQHPKRQSLASSTSPSQPQISTSITQTIIFPKQVLLNYSQLQQFILPPPPKQNQSMVSNNNISSYNNPNSNNSIAQQPSTSKKPKSFTITESKQLIFNYQIIKQQNLFLETNYCIVHFKRKQRSNHHHQHHHLPRNQQLAETLSYQNHSMIKRRSRNLSSNNDISIRDGFAIKVNGGELDVGGIVGGKHQDSPASKQSGKKISSFVSSNNSNSIQKSQLSSFSPAKLAYRESFIRQSKPYNDEQSPTTDDDNQSTKSSTKLSSAQLSSQKNFCLPWPIILPLIIVHILYLSATDDHSSTLQYLYQTFTFYDMYQLTILKQLTLYTNLASFQSVNYIQQMKQLWMQGYGFFQDSLLVFQNYAASDSYLTDRLYSVIITQNHYNIYYQISQSLSQQQQYINNIYLAIIIILAVFILYILVDFLLNLHYCFKISSQVTNIILIFLNISEKDINKLILSIEHYQERVLEINDFKEIRKIVKREEESYNLDERNQQQVELSGLGLLKGRDNGMFRGNSFKIMGMNLDSMINSPYQKSASINSILTNSQLQVFPYNEQPSRPLTIAYNNSRSINSEQRNINRFNTLRRKRSSRPEKINIDRLRETLGFLNESGNDDDNEEFQGIIEPQEDGSIANKQLINNVSDIVNKSFQSQQQQLLRYNSIQKHQSRKIKKNLYPISQQQQFTQVQLSKLQKISKFKLRFRGKMNDVKQHPYLYAVLLIALVIAAIVLIVSMVIIPQYITTFETFQQRYFDLRAMKIIIYKQLIQKITNTSLLPNITSTVYGQILYSNVKNTLNALPQFEQFWATVYTNDTCPLLNDKQAQKVCVSIGVNITGYGQKIMLQFIEDLLRRLTVEQLFMNSTSPSANATSTLFLNVVNLQIGIISQAEALMREQITQYTQSVKSIETIIVIVGTLMLMICILLSRRALKGILAKIQDGENLLLVMPQGIKKKYIGSVKRTKSIKEIKQLQNKQNKLKLQRQRRQKRLSTLIHRNNNNNTHNLSLQSSQQPSKSSPQQQSEQSAINLISHSRSSSFGSNHYQEELLRQSLKNRTQLKLNSNNSSISLSKKRGSSNSNSNRKAKNESE